MTSIVELNLEVAEESMRTNLAKFLFSLTVILLTACGGETPTYSVGGTLSGLAAGNSITLTNNGTDSLTLSVNGTFEFPAKLANSASFKLALSATTPMIQSCAATNATGTINGGDITTVQVICDTKTESAGLVQFVRGDVQQMTLFGQKHEVQKGDAVNEGDTLITGSKASARIKMNDGGLITVRPDTQFKIDSFKFNGKQDDSEQSFFSLVRGGFRSVTGLVGKLNKKNYRINTPMAVLGIRGTDHEILFVAPGSDLAKLAPVGTYDRVYSGSTTLTNDKGTIAIEPKQMGYVAASDQKPQLKPVDAKLFAAETEPLNPFDGRWATKLVCDDTTGPKGFVKGYTWEFDVIVEHGKLNGQYGTIGSPGSGTFIGQVNNDGTADLKAQGLTGRTDYTVGKVARGTPFDYPMNGKFSGSSGHATRTKLRPCEATFTRQPEVAR
jgi:hypothetical protein